MSLIADIAAVIGGGAAVLFKKKPYRLWLWYDHAWHDHGQGSARRLKKYKQGLRKTLPEQYILILAPGIKPIPLKEDLNG